MSKPLEIKQSPPNICIVITGTPGVGKSTISRKVAEKLGFEHIDVSTLVKSKKFYTEYDEKWDTYYPDEDMLLDYLELQVADKNLILDWHTNEIYPQRWVNWVFVIRCPSTEILYDRLKARSYTPEKISENIDAEIFNVVADFAEESYDKDIITELVNETEEDLESNIATIEETIGLLREALCELSGEYEYEYEEESKEESE